MLVPLARVRVLVQLACTRVLVLLARVRVLVLLARVWVLVQLACVLALVQPACVLVLRLQGRGTWRRAREQERGGERATDCCGCCYGCEIAVADEMLPARLALRCGGEVLTMAMATAMLATATVMATLPMVRWWR